MKKSILPQMRHLYSVIFAALLVACGSSKGVGYADGIYNDSPEAKQEAPPAEATETSTDLNTQYYKNYFADTAQEVEDINGNSEVFTDVDSYSSNYTNDSIPPQNFTNNGGWGSSTTEVVINNYNSGWAGGIGFSFGFAWGGWYGPGWGWGYYPPPFYGCYYPPYYAPTYGYGYGYTYVNSYRGNSYVADYGRSGRSGTRSLASNSVEARRSSLASRDRRGRSVTRLTEPRLNTDITRSTRNTVASNNRATRSARSVPEVRNSRSRSYSSNPSRSYSSRNGTSTRSNGNSRVRSNQSSSRYNSTNSRARSTTRSTYNRGSSTPSTRSYSAPRSSSSSSRGSMSRGGGSRGSSGGARGGRGGRG